MIRVSGRRNGPDAANITGRFIVWGRLLAGAKERFAASPLGVRHPPAPPFPDWIRKLLRSHHRFLDNDL